MAISTRSVSSRFAERVGRACWRLFGAVTVVLLGLLGLPAPAAAAVAISAVPSFAPTTVPGEVAPAQLTIFNNSTGPEAVVPVTITDITIIPSCGGALPPCLAPDPNVFQLNGPFVGTGSPGAACPTAYTATVINPTTGEVRLTPVGGPPVLDVGESCTVSFTTTTLRVPSIDVLPATPGVQTAQIVTTTALASNGTPGGGFGSGVATVNPAPAAIVTQANPQQVDVGEAFSDLATVTGPPGAPAPTGTVTFRLFGPTPGSPTCTEAPAFTSAPVALTATGPTTATAGSGPVGAAPPLAPGNYVFVASYSGDANYLGGTTACGDPAERVTVQPLPTVTVTATADPLTRPEPGGSFTYTVVVTNTSPEPVTITTLTDNVYGNLATQGTCTTAIGTTLAASPGPGNTYTCSYPGSFNAAAPASQTNVVTAAAVDSDGNTATDDDDATVSVTPSPPAIDVQVTPAPSSRPAPGGTFTYTVVVTNQSQTNPVTISTVVDDVYGNLASRPGSTCNTAPGTVLAAAPGPGNTYTCSFTGDFNGGGGAAQTNVVTVRAVDQLGREATDSDDATVELTQATPTIVTQAVTPVTLGSPIADSATIANGVAPTGTITFTVFGPDDATCSGPPRTSSVVPVNGNGSYLSAVYTATAIGSYRWVAAYSGDANNAPVTSPCNAPNETSVVVAAPTIIVDKTAAPASRPAPGGDFTYTVTVTNTSAVGLTIISITDDVYGNLGTRAGSTCGTAVGTVLPPAGSYTCAFTAAFTGVAGSSLTDVVTVAATDVLGAVATDSDDAVVTLTAAPAPTIAVAKTATPPSRVAPGGTFTFDVLITNDGPVPVTVTAVTDDIYGNLATRPGSSCGTAVGAVLAPTASVACSFTGDFTGPAGSVQTDIVTVTATAADGAVATGTDDATVMITAPPPPGVQLDATVTPVTAFEPGGVFRFGFVVTNTGPDPVRITGLSDNVYGDLTAVAGSTCDDAVGTPLAVGATYSCFFLAPFVGNAGATQTNVTTVTVVNDSGVVGTDSDDITITLGDLAPTVALGLTATPTSRPEPGGTFTFTVTIRNTTFEPVTITNLTDNVHGDSSGLGTCTNAVGTTLAPGVTYTCTYARQFFGPAGSAQTNTVSVSFVDDDAPTSTLDDEATSFVVRAFAVGSTTASATITITPAEPPTTSTTGPPATTSTTGAPATTSTTAGGSTTTTRPGGSTSSTAAGAGSRTTSSTVRPASGSGIPRTGSNSDDLVWPAAALLLAGCGFLIAARRRGAPGWHRGR